MRPRTNAIRHSSCLGRRPTPGWIIAAGRPVRRGRTEPAPADEFGCATRSNRPTTRSGAEGSTATMKLTTITHVSVDGVMQGLGGADEDRRGGFERGGWALPLMDEEGGRFVGDAFRGAGAFLFGRWPYEPFARYWGAITDSTNPIA